MPTAKGAGEAVRLLPRRLGVVRIEIGEKFSGLDPDQHEIEIATGFGGGDCGYPFQVGMDYIVYAYKNAQGRLETGICSRTRPLAQAADGDQTAEWLGPAQMGDRNTKPCLR